MPQIRFKRGTRAQLDTAAGASGLVQGEPYLITDEGVIAVGAGTSSYAEALPRTALSGAAAIAVVDELPSTPDPNILYFIY